MVPRERDPHGAVQEDNTSHQEKNGCKNGVKNHDVPSGGRSSKENGLEQVRRGSPIKWMKGHRKKIRGNANRRNPLPRSLPKKKKKKTESSARGLKKMEGANRTEGGQVTIARGKKADIWSDARESKGEYGPLRGLGGKKKDGDLFASKPVLDGSRGNLWMECHPSLGTRWH